MVQLAWILSQLEIGEDASPPGGVSAKELRQYLDKLVNRLFLPIGKKSCNIICFGA